MDERIGYACEQLINSIDYKIIINNLNIRFSNCIEKNTKYKSSKSSLSLSLSLFHCGLLLSSSPATGGLLASTQAQPTRAPNHVQRILELRQRRCVQCLCWVSLSLSLCASRGKGHSASQQASTVLWDPAPAAAACGVSRASHVDGDRCP